MTARVSVLMKRHVYTGDIDWRGTAERVLAWIVVPLAFWGTVIWIVWRTR